MAQPSQLISPPPANDDLNDNQNYCQSHAFSLYLVGDIILMGLTCLSTLHTRPSILMSWSRDSPSGRILSLIFLSMGICPFPKIWSTL